MYSWRSRSPSVVTVSPAVGEVAHLDEQVADAVEGLRDRVGAPVDLALQAVGLAPQPPPPLGPARVRLAVGAAVAGVGPHPAAQLVDAVGARSVTSTAAPTSRRRVVGHLRPQAGGEVATGLGVAGVELPGHPHRAERLHRRRYVVEAEPAQLVVLGDDRRRGGLAPAPAVGHDDDRQAAVPAGRDPHDVADLQRLERLGRVVAHRGRAPLGPVALELADLVTDRGVLAEVAEVAAHRLRVAGEGLLVAAHGAHEADDGAVGLELGERGLEDGAGRLAAELAHEVDGHVVGGAEARAQRVGAGRGEPRHGRRVETAVPQHHRVALDVDAAPPGPAGQLGVLRRRDVDVALAVELDQLLQHDGARRHVDAEGQGLGGEDGPDPARP